MFFPFLIIHVYYINSLKLNSGLAFLLVLNIKQIVISTDI